MSDLQQHQQDWETLGHLDPLWAVLSDSERRFGKWSEEEFFATGESEIDKLMERAASHGLPRQHGRALDFGCGVGRLARPLARRFSEVVALDISANMISRARQYLAACPNVRFVHNTSDDLRSVGDEPFDLIYSNIVLQHVPTQELIEQYVREFLRCLRPGGLAVFQVPCNRSWKVWLNPRQRLWQLLRRLGFGADFIYHRFKLSPIRMTAVPEARIIAVVEASGGSIVHIERNRAGGPNAESRTYYVTKQA